MRKHERVEVIRKRLAEWFPETPIPLEHSDSFTLLIAVLLSAQCTDKRVNLVTPSLFAKASTPEEMVKLGENEIRAIIRPCGLAPAKAKAIAALSRIMVEKYEGKVPSTLEELEALPGVGHKTASVLMVQAFGEPAFPVDTHIHRLSRVWKLSSGKNVVQTEKDLKRLFPEEEWAALHLRMIFFGREKCPARGCNGKRCELCQELFAPAS